MSNTLTRLYHQLPAPIRSVAANCRGFYLRSWRYGPETESQIDEASERETWSADRWKTWQEERLSFVLHRAATKVPFYRNYWTRQRRNGNRSSWEVLENWPVLKKEQVRENPLAFVAEDCNYRQMFRDHTSGTTGTPLNIYIKKETVRKWYSLYERRLRRWHGVSIRERWAMLGGQQIIPVDKTTPPFWVFNAGLNQLYLSTFHLSPQSVKCYIDALNRYKPTHMVSYPSAAYLLARASLEKGLPYYQMKVIISNAEMLLDEHIKIISEAFQCPVRNTYGMVEIAAAASECEEGSMHIWPEVGMIEVFDDGQDLSAKKGEVGRLILTGLINADMPLIRYEVGDRGSLGVSGKECFCGRTLPHLSRIEGRLRDALITTDGRQIFTCNSIFRNLPVKEGQIVQENLKHIHVRLIPAPGYSDRDERTLSARLRVLVGNVEISLDIVDHIPRSANGKFQEIISRVPSEHKKVVG